MAEHIRESSMEEILSSIKRIIAEDKAIETDRPATNNQETQLSEDETPDDSSVSDNVTPIASLPRNIISKGTSKNLADKSTNETSASDNAETVLELTNKVSGNLSHTARGVFGDRRKEERLINDKKLDAMRQSLSALVAMEGSNTSAPEKSNNGTSLEDLTRDLMRPMLQKWLDEHLPGLVEEMVAREIRRLNEK
ncbi:DUF2497 domain-containing protein [Parasphingorhabdus sp. JC815]|uniref:DUF2497 domain-containing protein n=1 Tax=Parasphingorhabdus sp. JC815 TaxID=3232140 RepID=UPI003457AC84